MYRAALGPLGFSRASSTAAEIRRTSVQIARSTERLFLIHMAEEGAFTVMQRGREAMVNQGDFTITDCAEPFLLSHHRPCTAIVVRVPEAVLKASLLAPEDLAGLVVCGHDGLGAIAAGLMSSVCRQMQLAENPQTMSGVSRALLDVVAAAYAPHSKTVSESSTGVARRVYVRRYIETHLQDSELNPARVAAAFRVSGRRARAIFEAEGEGMSAYILRRRLEECARWLRDPRCIKRSISEIAFTWGFNSLGSFCRAFKTKYHVTPGEFRASAPGGADLDRP